MDLVDFNTWWKQFLAEPRIHNARDGGSGAVEELRRHVAAMPPNLRTEFVDELAAIACARSDGWGLALGALERHCSPQGFARVARHASSLVSSKAMADASALSDLLRVLAKSGDAGHRQIVAGYLLARPIGLYWTSVPWALWPDDPDLFGRSWARYFSTAPVSEWRDTAIVQAFLSSPDALACVRDGLRALDGPAWGGLREALLKGIDSPWLSEGQREQVRRVCGETG